MKDLNSVHGSASAMRFDGMGSICYPKRMIAAKFLLALSLLLAFALYSPEIKAQGRPRIVIGHASMSSVVLTLWAAQDKGFFAKNNLDVQLVFIPGSPTLIATLNTGDVHFGFTGGTATLGAAVAGLDVRMIAAFANRVQS